jgi:tetratricopeptide (TPR) repeat protein
VIALLLLIGPPAPVHAAVALAAETAGLPARSSDADAQFAGARTRHREARSARGAARLLAMEAALRAYRAVEAYWPDASDLCAEAAFRRGEVEVALDRPGRARGAWECVLDVDGDADWSARARLGLAALAGEHGEPEQAARHCAEVLALPGASARWRNDAHERLARLHLQQQRFEAAAEQAEAWLAEVSSSVEEVRAVDLLARARIGDGRVAEAAGVVQALQQRMAGLAARGGEEAAALRRALARMRAPDLLRPGRPRPPP